MGHDNFCREGSIELPDQSQELTAALEREKVLMEALKRYEVCVGGFGDIAKEALSSVKAMKEGK